VTRLVLVGVTVLVAAGLTVRRRGWSALGPWLLAAIGLTAVAIIHLAYGFNWLTGLGQLRIRYYQGIASSRPFSYYVYANFAAWLISCSPFLAIGVSRSVRILTRRVAGSEWPERVIATLAMSGVLAALLADLSALSKAETERIWLTFGVFASSALALLRGRAAAWTLVGCAGTALLVNHLFRTGW
jgi:hypothetical protein